MGVPAAAAGACSAVAVEAAGVLSAVLAEVLEAGVLQAARLSDRVAAPSRAAARLVRFFMLVSTP